MRTSPFFEGCKPLAKLQLSIAQYSPQCYMNVLLLQKDQTFIFFAVTGVGGVPCGGPKKFPPTSSIVQIIFLFRSFEISKDIQCVQNTHVWKHTSKQCLNFLIPFDSRYK